MDDGHHQPARRLCGEAQVDVAQLHDLLGLDVDARVELGELREAGNADPREQRHQADAGLGVDGLDLVLGGHQSGRVDVDPGRDVGDLATAGGHLVGDRLAHTTQRDPYVASPLPRDRTRRGGRVDGPERGFHVGPADHLPGPGGSQPGQVDSRVLGQSSNDRRDDLGRQGRCGDGGFGHARRGRPLPAESRAQAQMTLLVPKSWRRMTSPGDDGSALSPRCRTR